MLFRSPGFGWRDARVLKVGAVYRWQPAWTLRAGLSHASQPVPASETFFNILAPGVVQDHLTAGFTWTADAHTEWSAYYAHAFDKRVAGRGSIPASFGGGESTVHLSENLFGVSWSWRF